MITRSVIESVSRHWPALASSASTGHSALVGTSDRMPSSHRRIGGASGGLDLPRWSWWAPPPVETSPMTRSPRLAQPIARSSSTKRPSRSEAGRSTARLRCRPAPTANLATSHCDLHGESLVQGRVWRRGHDPVRTRADLGVRADDGHRRPTVGHRRITLGR